MLVETNQTRSFPGRLASAGNPLDPKVTGLEMSSFPDHSLSSYCLQRSGIEKRLVACLDLHVVQIYRLEAVSYPGCTLGSSLGFLSKVLSRFVVRKCLDC